MGVTKLKPSRTPRLLDQWTEEKEMAYQATVRGSEVAIQNSKKLVAQSKEILAKVERDRGPKKITRRKAG